jgi:arsenite methyltransferase
MSMLQFDDDAARHIQRVYSTPDVVQQRAEVLALFDAQRGERVLDVGSGPGFLVASLADAVGPSGAVHGLDQSAPMNDVARELTGDRAWVSIDEGDALELPYPGGAFDAAVTTQVSHQSLLLPRDCCVADVRARLWGAFYAVAATSRRALPGRSGRGRAPGWDRCSSVRARNHK